MADYLLEEWSEKVVAKFFYDISKSVKQLETMPFMFPASNMRIGIRRCVVNKNTILFYRVNEEMIEIVNVKNARQNIDNN